SRSGHVSFVNTPNQRSVLVCWLGEPVAAEALLVLLRDTPFTNGDARPAVEIADHAVGALRRTAPRSSMSERPESYRLSDVRASPDEQVVQDQQHDRAHGCDDDGGDVDAGDQIARDEKAYQKATDDSTDNADQDCDDPVARILAGHDHFRKHTRDQA